MSQQASPIQLFQCTECGALASPPNGVQVGHCGLRRGMGSPPATVCTGAMKFVGWFMLVPASGHSTEGR